MTTTTQTPSGSHQEPTLTFPMKGDAQFDLCEARLKEISQDIAKKLTDKEKEEFRNEEDSYVAWDFFKWEMIYRLSKESVNFNEGTDDCQEFIDDITDDLAMDRTRDIGVKK